MQSDLFTTTPPLSFAAPRSRRHDPSTSKAAAESMHGEASEHHELILAVLNDHEGLTATEIGCRCKLSSVQVARRMKELERLGLAETTGETRRTEAGRQARVWRVC